MKYKLIDYYETEIKPRAFRRERIGRRPDNDFYFENLATLAEVLENLPKDAMGFDMSSYMRGEHSQSIHDPREHGCGTSGCAVGHALRAGINKEIIKDCKMWDDYCDYTFCETETDTWNFLFGPDHINDPKAAARRIRYFLQNGLPIIGSERMNMNYFEVIEVE